MKHNTRNIRLDEKIILITGAGDGIGKAISIECARRGATVVLLGKTPQKLDNVYDAIIDLKLPKPAIVPVDLENATPDMFTELHNTLENEFGHLDGLINHAGWLGASSPIQLYDEKLWHRVFQINLNAPFMLTKACIPLLSKADHASIVFTVDPKDDAYWGAYGVAKAGLESFMRILASEMESKNIAVNGFNPGPVRTRHRTMAYPAENPQGLNKPENVTGAYIYLLGLQDTSNNGHTYTLDDFEV